MAGSTTLFTSKQRQSRNEAAAFLRDLADRLEAGKVTLRQGTSEVDLAPAEALTVEIEASEKPRHGGLRQELEIEIKWTEGDAGAGKLELG